MKYSVKKIATGIGIAGLMGGAAIAAEDTQIQGGSAYAPQQKQEGTSQGTMAPEQSGQPGEKGAMSPSQSGRSGSKETASSSKSERAGEHQKQGTIRSVNPSSKTLSIRTHLMHDQIAWSADTQVLRNGKPVSAAELRKGEQVRVTVRKEGDKLIAQRIVIQERQQARATKRSHQNY